MVGAGSCGPAVLAVWVVDFAPLVAVGGEGEDLAWMNTAVRMFDSINFNI